MSFLEVCASKVGYLGPLILLGAVCLTQVYSRRVSDVHGLVSVQQREDAREFPIVDVGVMAVVILTTNEYTSADHLWCGEYVSGDKGNTVDKSKR